MYTLSACLNVLEQGSVDGSFEKLETESIEQALSSKKRRDMDASTLEVGDVLMFSDKANVTIFKGYVNGNEYYGFVVPVQRGGKTFGIRLSFSIFDRVAFEAEKNADGTWQRKMVGGKAVIRKTTGTAVDVWKSFDNYWDAYNEMTKEGKNIVVSARNGYFTQRPVKDETTGKWTSSPTEVTTTYIHKFDYVK